MQDVGTGHLSNSYSQQIASSISPEYLIAAAICSCLSQLAQLAVQLAVWTGSSGNRGVIVFTASTGTMDLDSLGLGGKHANFRDLSGTQKRQNGYFLTFY